MLVGGAREEAPMKVNVGDHLVIHGHQVGRQSRDCEVLEVHGKEGGPPYRVRWTDDGHEGLFFPGSDADVEAVVEEA
jgi:hypothetical protein